MAVMCARKSRLFHPSNSRDLLQNKAGLRNFGEKLGKPQGMYKCTTILLGKQHKQTKQNKPTTFLNQAELQEENPHESHVIALSEGTMKTIVLSDGAEGLIAKRNLSNQIIIPRALCKKQ